MQDTRVTIASLRSTLKDPQENMRLVEQACRQARDEGARLVLLPELMLTGHGGHQTMVEHAEEVPDGPLSSAIIELSAKYDLCICIGLAELSFNTVYNSQMVADKGTYLGLQRKINLSRDEYCYFGAGESVEIFDIGEVRFGITICYDNCFPELALIHNLHHADLILAPHAARTGDWPEFLTDDFCRTTIANQQEHWEMVHRARAFDHNVFVLLCNAVGSATEGVPDVVANHAGTVMGIAPRAEVFLRTEKVDFTDEIVTVDLPAAKRRKDHRPDQNRRLLSLIEMLSKAKQSRR